MSRLISSQGQGRKPCPLCDQVYLATSVLQWRSQNEQVTSAHHGHTQCVRNTHSLGDLGHAPGDFQFLAQFIWKPVKHHILTLTPSVLF